MSDDETEVEADPRYRQRQGVTEQDEEVLRRLMSEGGPAHPLIGYPLVVRGQTLYDAGPTYRDALVLAALQGLCASVEFAGRTAADVAEAAVERADETLARVRAPRTPVAWFRGHRTPGSPSGPEEWDVDLAWGEDRPEGEGWEALHR